MSTEDQQTCSKIITQCPRLDDEDGWISVKWDKGRKKKDNYSDLCQKREEFIKGEDIWKQTVRRKTKPKSWLMEDVADQMIENLKKELMAKQTSLQSSIENESSSDEDLCARNWSKVQLQMKELKRENKRLKEDNVKEILDAMKLPAVVTKLKEVIGQITLQTSPPASTCATPSPSVDLPVSACVSPQVLSDDMVFLMPGCDVKVPKRKLNSLRTTNPSVYIGDLAVLVYGRETLSHSNHALSKFPDLTMQDVRRIIRKKCNNESYIKQATAKKPI
ncbi:Dihydroxy-acid dehydratase [Labeo rohita]|uniref:Dihydroxy-acid dehydratase n=1 Tax=Labeo rohita TaxID=84645 RepID=A0ABQ8L4J5_LABRO|nr:Dihydroxy-acid dehydratase [Labeo rohita]